MQYKKYILPILATLLIAPTAFAASVLFPYQGGTGQSSFTASQLLYGNLSAPLSSVATTSVTCSGKTTCSSFTAIGASPITISSSGGGTVSTSSSETATYIPFWTSTNGTPALLSGGVSNFTFTSATNNLKVLNASTTALSATVFCLIGDTCRTTWPTGTPYPFPLTGNATSSLTQFNGGLNTLTIQATSTTATSSITNLGGVLDVTGFVGTGSGDIGDKANSAYASAGTYGTSLTIDAPASGTVWSQTTPIVIGTLNAPANINCAIGGGAQNNSGNYQGFGLLYTPTTGTSTTFDNSSYISSNSAGINGCNIQGTNGTTARNTEGVYFGGANGSFDGYLNGVNIDGFGTGVSFHPNTSFNTIMNSTIHFNGVNVSEPNTSGANCENQRILNSVIADANNQKGGATALKGLYVQESGNCQWNIALSSLDDNQSYFDQFGGTSNEDTFLDDHQENPNGTAYPMIGENSGGANMILNLIGGDMMNDDTSGQGDQIEARGVVNLIGFTSDSDNNVSIPVTRIVNALASSTEITWDGLACKGANAGSFVYGNVGCSPFGIGSDYGQPSLYVATTTSSVPGYVGIATSTPWAPLTVTGTGYFSGALTTGGLTLQNLSGTQCLHEISGVVSGSGSDCGSGGAAYPFTTSSLLNSPNPTQATSSILQSTGGLAISSSTDPIANLGGTTANGQWPFVINNPNSTIGSSTGIGFSVTSNPGGASQNGFGVIGGGIGFTRTGASDAGQLFFATTPVGGQNTVRQTISSAGLIGVNQTTPSYQFDVTGNGHFSSLVDADHFVATSTSNVSTFADGFNALASSTIGNGGTGGLTVNGNATTTGNQYVGGVVGINTPIPTVLGTTQTFDITNAGSAQNVVSLIRSANNLNDYMQFQPAGSNTTTNVNWIMGMNANSDNFTFGDYDGNSVVNRLVITDKGSFGVASSSPYGLFAIHALAGTTQPGNLVVNIASSTATFSTSTLMTLSNTGVLTLPGLTSGSTGNYVCDNGGIIENSGSTCSISSQKVKNSIEPLQGGLSDIMGLTPVSFKYDEGFGDSGSSTQLGLIAEATAKTNPLLAEYATAPLKTPNGTIEPGQPDGINWNGVTADLVLAVQQQQKEIATLKAPALAAAHDAQDNWQWAAIGLLAVWNIALTLRRRK